MSPQRLPQILIAEPIHPAGVELLSKFGEVHQLPSLDSPGYDDLWAQVDAVVIRSSELTASIMSKAPNLRVIGRHGAGTDNIDKSAAKRRGIIVVNTPHSNTDSVAEYVITVALMLLKRIPELSRALRDGLFAPHMGSLPGQVDRMGLTGRDAAGTRLGIVGAGAIGYAAAQRATALGMHVRAYDPFVDKRRELGFEIVEDLEELLANSDIVSLHVPGGNDNRHLIGSNEIAQMPAGSILINAARGSLVDLHALVEALHSGHLSGAAMDVFASEPPPNDDEIFFAPNLILTPHMAAMTAESLRRMSIDVANELIRALGEATPSGVEVSVR